MQRLSFRFSAMALLGISLLCYFVYAFAPRPLPVDLASVEKASMQMHVEEDGYTRAREIYMLSAPVSGTLLRVNADPGDRVEAGKTILASLRPQHIDLLDPRRQEQARASIVSAEAAVSLAQAQWRRAKLQHDQAKRDFARGTQLAKEKMISDAALERLDLALQASKAEMATAAASQDVRQAELANARAMLTAPMPAALPTTNNTQSLHLIAPVSGQVLRVLQESESPVAAGTALIEIGDPQDLEIIVDLLSQDAVKVQAGASAIIEDWGGDGPLRAKVRRVEPAGFTKVSALGIEEQRVNVIIDLLDPAPLRIGLGHGYRVQVRIITWQQDEVLRIPAGALFRVDHDWAAFRVTDGRAQIVKLDIGQHNGRTAELRSGLNEGEQIILHPSEHIHDGSRVEARP